VKFFVVLITMVFVKAVCSENSKKLNVSCKKSCIKSLLDSENICHEKSTFTA
ncbi:44014_t:CDS:1, partial [Gigaspora margarita]